MGLPQSFELASKCVAHLGSTNLPGLGLITFFCSLLLAPVFATLGVEADLGGSVSESPTK